MVKEKQIIEGISLDIETGGLNPKRDGICSVGMYINNEIKEHFFIKPNKELNYSEIALEVSNITMEQLENEGISEAEAVNRIKNFFSERTIGDKKPLLMGQNINFDIGFLRELFYRNTTFLSFDELFYYHVVDSMHWKIFMKMLGIYDGEINLEESYNKITGNKHLAHNALEDAKAAKEEILAIIKKAKKEKWKSEITL